MAQKRTVAVFTIRRPPFPALARHGGDADHAYNKASSRYEVINPSLWHLTTMRVGKILQRLELAQNDGFAPQRDPAQADPAAQVLVGRLARQAGEFADRTLRQPQIDTDAALVRLALLLRKMQQPPRP